MQKRYRVLVLAFLLAGSAVAQTVVVDKNTILRRRPSSHSSALFSLTPGSELVLLETDAKNGYYHVRASNGSEGWVWGQNINIKEPIPVPTPTPAPPPPVANDSSPLLVGVVLLLGGLTPVGIWAHYRWKKLKPELFPDETENKKIESDADVRQSAKNLDSGRIQLILARAQANMEQDESADAKLVASRMRTLAPHSSELAELTRSLVVKSLDTAELTSALVQVQDGNMYAYIVIVPNRHEHPHLFRRYAPFSAGWRYHLELIRASLTTSGNFSALVAYLFFLNPGASDFALLISYADAESLVVPSGLLEASELNRKDVRSLDISGQLSMAA